MPRNCRPTWSRRWAGIRQSPRSRPVMQTRITVTNPERAGGCRLSLWRSGRSRDARQGGGGRQGGPRRAVGGRAAARAGQGRRRPARHEVRRDADAGGPPTLSTMRAPPIAWSRATGSIRPTRSPCGRPQQGPGRTSSTNVGDEVSVAIGRQASGEAGQSDSSALRSSALSSRQPSSRRSAGARCGPGPEPRPGRVCRVRSHGAGGEDQRRPGPRQFRQHPAQGRNDAEQFAARWSQRLAAAKPPAVMVSLAEVKTGIEEGMAAQREDAGVFRHGHVALGVAVHHLHDLEHGGERAGAAIGRARAVGTARDSRWRAWWSPRAWCWRVIGWIGGLAAGWGLLPIASHAKPDLFPQGRLAGAVVRDPRRRQRAWAGRWPRRSSPRGGRLRVSPWTPCRRARPARAARWPWATVAVGAVLIAVNPLLVFVVPMADESRYGIYAAHRGAPAWPSASCSWRPWRSLAVGAALRPDRGPAAGRGAPPPADRN